MSIDTTKIITKPYKEQRKCVHHWVRVPYHLVKMKWRNICTKCGAFAR